MNGSGVRWPGVELAGLLSVGVTLALMVTMEVLGPDSKSTLWRRVHLGVICGVFIVGTVLLGCAVARAVRGQTRRRVLWPVLLAAALLGLGGAILVPTYHTIESDIAGVNEVAGFSRALLYFAEDHSGSLPAGLADLLDGGYVRPDGRNRWRVDGRNGEGPCFLRNPTWFDVAWGVTIRDLDTEGVVVGAGRPVVRRAPLAPEGSFDAVCRAISGCIGRFAQARGAPD